MALRHRDINLLFFGYTALNNRMMVKGKVIYVSCFLGIISASMEEIVKLERICNRLSSNLESNAGGSEYVHRGMLSILYTKSGFLTSSLQSDHFHGRFPANTFYTSLCVPQECLICTLWHK